MRIAYLLTQDRGGPVDVTVQLAAAMIDFGADVRVFGPKPARGAALVADHFEPVSVSSKGDLAAGRKARAALRAWRPDVVHAQDRRSGLVCSGLRGPVVHTYHGVPDDVCEAWFRGGGGPPSAYTRTVLAADAVVARTVSRTVVPSPTMADFLARRLRVPRRRLVHIDNCVRLPAYDPPSRPVRRLAFVGLLVARKGLFDLFEALATPGTMPADATLTVIGDGPEREAAERAAARVRGVRFLGFRSDVAELVREHDALVLPSRLEQQPLVVAQAMAAGKPVVATNTGGVADMLWIPGVPPLLAEPGDVPGLAAQLRALFAEENPARTSGLLATAARTRFAPDTCARRHLELYHELTTKVPIA